MPEWKQAMLLQRTVRKLLADNDALLARLQTEEAKERLSLLHKVENLKKEMAALVEKNRRLSEQLKRLRLCAVWEIEKQMLNYAEKFI